VIVFWPYYGGYTEQLTAHYFWAMRRKTYRLLSSVDGTFQLEAMIDVCF
jgi:hypothetical protein